MPYHCLIIDDSGAVEYSDHFLDTSEPDVNTVLRNAEKDFSISPPGLELEMYDDANFNKLNDILHAPDNLVMNDRALSIFESSTLPQYSVSEATVSRVSRTLWFKKINKYSYHWLYFNPDAWAQLYHHIDFEKSHIDVLRDNKILDTGIRSLDDIAELREAGKYFQLSTKKIVFKIFCDTIDMFMLPHFSWMIYVSGRLKNKLVEGGITGIKFVEPGKPSRLESVQNPVLEFI